MPRNILEHSPIYQEDYDRPESLEEWRQRAVEPFIHHMMDHNPNLAVELASMADPGTDLSHVTWLDDGDNDMKDSRRLRCHQKPTQSEHDILDSYRESQYLLDPVQQQHAAEAIADAMCHRPTSKVDHHLPKGADYNRTHHDTNVPFGNTYNRVMNAARAHYIAALERTHDQLSQSLQERSLPDFAAAARDLREIELDVAYTAAYGKTPEHTFHLQAGQEYHDAVKDRTNVITDSFNFYLKEKYSGSVPRPEYEQYAAAFHQYAEQFTEADQEWMARKIAGDFAKKQTNHLEYDMEADYRYATAYRSILLNLKPSIAGDTGEL